MYEKMSMGTEWVFDQRASRDLSLLNIQIAI